ncbi:MAG: hypothetical protein KJ989_14545 [Gammaproteobacteria bacterium]|nr:hypothetical protein [Gammaproteobacteria bacterium]MBU2158417.1 hypothetical protein [Gammaproteobacteria bacterium]MBU2257041.1 hypothetical protein [Gammaproteobacteria bacterium]MBU2295417.1 hypothetical protein [Gammaproteobacteria bacterium]
MSHHYRPLLLALLSFSIFSVGSFWRAQQPLALAPQQVKDRVVIAAPILLALYAGDRFLAANLETIRLSATGMQGGQGDISYLVRAQQVVSELNACQEDNYYLANGLLTWGGAVNEGNKVLRAAVQCRTWDFVPAFFYGVNLAFFERDITEAQRVLEVAAQRSPENAAGLRKMAIMLQVKSFANERLAMNYLVQQRDAASDPKLRDMLDLRVVRLQGLLALREAQHEFEVKHGKLSSLDQLVERGFIPNLPADPLRLGYELVNGRIVLKKLKIAGMENQL